MVVIGGISGIGLDMARRARAEGADLVITGRNADRLHEVGLELGAGIAAVDGTDLDRLERFFDALPGPVDHVLVTVPDPQSTGVDAHLPLSAQVARNAARKIRPGGMLLFLAGAEGRPPATLTKSLALECAPVRVNLIVGSADVAALAVHLMTNAAVTGATLEV